MGRFRVLSLGAGVQSTTLALMAAHNEIEAPECAIFADTQAETAATYAHLAWLETILTFPVHHVSKGDLAADFLSALDGANGCCGQPPFYVRNPDNDGTAAADSGGVLWRKCTKEYKLEPLRRKVRELSRGRAVDQLIGISVDEAHRMKASGVRYITNCYPLVEKRMTRSDCIAWLGRHDYATPPKSACYFCPYTSDERWRQMRREQTADWHRACSFDGRLRAKRATKLAAGIRGEIFVHRSMRPLEDVDFRSWAERGQPDLFGNDCEGICGV